MSQYYKTQIKATITIIVIISLMLFFSNLLLSCTKQYIENPTCRRYIEVCDRWDGEMNYMWTDTIQYYRNNENYACGDALKDIENYKPFIKGCITGGFERYRYIIIK